MCCEMKFYKALCFGGIIFYLAVLPLYINIMYEWYLRGELEIFLTFLVLLTSSTLVVNLVSAILVMRKADTNRSCCDRSICILMHCFQLGLLWRFSKLVISFNDFRFLEFSLLLVGQAATSFLPASLVEGAILKLNLDLPTGATVSFLVICVVSTAFSFVLTQLSFRYNVRESEDQCKVKACALSFCHLCGVLCLLTSRCVSIVLFFHSQTHWIALILGLHFLVCLMASLVYRYLELKRITFLCVLRQTGLMFLHVFDSISTSQGSSKCVSVLYYALIVVENIVMTAVWVMTSSEGSDISKLVTVMVMLGTFVLGVILKFVCHSCHEEDNPEEDSDMKTLDLMATSRASSVCLHASSKSRAGSRRTTTSNGVEDNQPTGASQRSTPRSKSANSKSSTPKSSTGKRSNGRQTPLTYHNAAFDDTPEQDTGKKEVFNVGDNHSKVFSKNRDRKLPSAIASKENVGRRVDRAPSKRSQINRLKLKAQRGYCSEELTDIGSSNSRNTNTLDVSAQSTTVAHCVRYQTEYDLDKYKNPTHLWYLNSPGTKANPQEITCADGHNQIRSKSCVPFNTKTSHPINNKQTCNKCSGYQDQRGTDHVTGAIIPQPVLRVDQLNRRDSYGYDCYTDTTSYYDSLSYYYTISSSSFTSDSDFAQTWPPSQPTGSQNHHIQLPDQKLTPEERISIWIQRSKQYFSQEFPKTSQTAHVPTSSLKKGRDRKNNFIPASQHRTGHTLGLINNDPKRWLKPGSKYLEKPPPPNYHVPLRTRNKQYKASVGMNYYKCEDSLSAFSHKAGIFAISGDFNQVSRQSVPERSYQSTKYHKQLNDIIMDRKREKPPRPPRPPREDTSGIVRLNVLEGGLTMSVDSMAELHSPTQPSGLESMV